MNVPFAPLLSCHISKHHILEFLNLQLPETCVFQTSWYTIVVEEEDSNGVPVVHRPHSFTGRDPVIVEQDISDGLEKGRNYSVTVWVESLAGQSPNTSVDFSECIV